MSEVADRTESGRAEVELDELLSESPAEAARRAAEHFDLRAGEALALYGAGNLGRQVLAGLRRLGVEPVAFADDTPSKQGQIVDGLAVMSPREVSERFGARVVFAVTIFNPAASYLRISRRLREETGARVVSFLSLMWSRPETFLPHYQYVLPQDVLADAAEIRRAFHVFSDEESRRQFVGHLRQRLWLDFEALPASSAGDYFPAGVVPELPAETTFVDCGAFDGDTVRRFLEHQRGRFREIHAFEPDPENCRQLNEYAASLGGDASERIHVHQAAAGARRARLRFRRSSDMGAALDAAGDTEVEVMAVSEVVRETDGASALYLKFDVEGAEDEALTGAEALIRRARPLIAVSVYHRPGDLWRLPLRLHALDPAYGIYLRTQGEDGMDVVCYAVPPLDGRAFEGARLAGRL